MGRPQVGNPQREVMGMQERSGYMRHAQPTSYRGKSFQVKWACNVSQRVKVLDAIINSFDAVIKCP